MGKRRNRALLWTLVGLGAAIVALGTTLLLTAPRGGGAAWALGPGRMGGNGYFRGFDRGTDGAAPSARDETAPSPRRDDGWTRGGIRGGRTRGDFGVPGWMGFGPRWPMALGGLVVAGLAIVGIAALARHGRHVYWRHGPHGPPEDAISILRRDFAEGKIDEAEYRRRLETLGSRGRRL